MRKLSSHKLEAAIGIPTSKWASRCHEISHLALESGCYQGFLRYGMYYGPVGDECSVAGWKEYYADHVPIRHGWIQLKTGGIIDPTHWVFFGNTPYIAHIPRNHPEYGHYDPGAQRLKTKYMLAEPPPIISKVIPQFQPQGALADWVVSRIGHGPPYGVEQLFWLANLPPSFLGRMGKALYRSLDKCGLRAAIPIDFWDLVMEEDPRRNPRKRRGVLAEEFPGVAFEWHPFKNAPLTPNDVTSGSARKVWWKCKRNKNHEWVASICQRTGASSIYPTECPWCHYERGGPFPKHVVADKIVKSNPVCDCENPGEIYG